MRLKLVGYPITIGGIFITSDVSLLVIHAILPISVG